MARGWIETLQSGFRARVYAGKDPITGKQTYLRGETRREHRDAEADFERLVAYVEADRLPDQHATLNVLWTWFVSAVGGRLGEIPVGREPAAVLTENARLSRAEADVYELNHFEIFHPWEQARLRRDLCRYDGCSAVLDVGAGTGNVVTKVCAAQRVAVDLSPEMLSRLRAKDSTVGLVVGLAEALPFRDAMFDLVVTYSTLHHLANWSALAEMRRVTRPGGVVLLDHEEAFHERGWRGLAYGALRAMLRLVARLWYWRRPLAQPYLSYRRLHWPYSAQLGPIDFWLTDGGHPEPVEIERELVRLGMTVCRRHYLLMPLPMSSRWQHVADRLCRRLRMGHFAIEARR